jgi:rod shape-determining protein MreD
VSALADRGTGAHTPRVIVLCVLAVGIGFLVQTSVLPAVGLSSAIPVLYAAVAVLGVTLGSRTGAIAGFGAGLMLDLTGAGVLGVGALTGSLLGAACGALTVYRWRWSGLLWVWMYTFLGCASYTVVNAVLSGRTPSIDATWLWMLGGSAVASAVLLPWRARIRAVVR